MVEFAQQVVAGLASGSIYALLALAIVIIYRSTGVVNFAQGEMATFTTFIAWTLIDHGLGYWVAFALTLVIAFVGGIALERIVVRPVEGGPVLTIVILTIGLFILFGGLSNWIWKAEVRSFPPSRPFPTSAWDIGGVAVSKQDAGILVVTLVLVLALYVLFQHTKLGLVLRAAALNPTASRLVGSSRRLDARVRVGPRRGDRRGRRDVHRCGCSAARAEHDAAGPHLRVRRGGARRPREPGRRDRRRPSDRRAAEPDRDLRHPLHLELDRLRLPIALALILIVLLVRPTGLFGRQVMRRV